MVVVGTIYDKSLKEKVFYIREVDAYSHSTTTSLNVEWEDNVFTLTAEVSNIVGKGYVKFYKDGVEIGEQYVSKTATLLYSSESLEGVFVARFMGNSDCLKSESQEVSYNRTDSALTVSNNGTTNKYVGDTVTVTCLLKDVDGNLITGASVSDGSTTKTTGSDGKATFTYTNSSAGTVSKTYSFSGDSDYNSCTGTTSWSVSKLPTTITVTSDKSTYIVGATTTVTATIKDVRGNAVSSVVVTLDGASLTTNSNGVVTKSYSNLSVGSYSKSCSYAGSTKYAGSTGSVSFTVVDKDVPVLSVSASKSSCYVDDSVTVTCTLKSSKGAVISGATVSDGSTTKTTNTSGVATFTYSNTASGSVTKNYSYSGSSEYSSATGKCSWTVNKYNSALVVTTDKSNNYVGSSVTVTAVLTGNGSPLSGVTVTLDGASLTTDSNGMVTKTYTGLAVNSYTKSASFAGNTKYKNCSNSVTFNVVDKDVPVLSVSPSKTSCYVDDSITVTCTLKSSSGTAISGATISDGTNTASTNSSGVATFTYSNTESGTVSKSYSYAGDSTYASATKGTSWTVNKYTTSLTLTPSATSVYVDTSVTLTGVLKDNNGNPVSGVSLTAPNDSTVTTDSNGKFTTTYQNTSTGTVNKTYTFAGNTKYEGCNGSASWTVNKYSTKLTVTSDKTSYNVGDTATVTATLKTTTGLAVGGVTVYIDNNAVTTNSNGVATKTFSCSTAGSVTKSVSYGGSAKYGSSTGSVSYSIVRIATSTSLTASKTNPSLGETVTFTATVTSGGSPVTSGDVIFLVDDTASGNATVNSSGVATWEVSKTEATTLSVKANYYGTTTLNGSVSSPVSVTWSEAVIVPELTISSDNLVGETDDVLSVSLASNLGSGASVSLVDASDNTLATTTTSSDGSATFNYTCTGAGDRSVHAKYLNGSEVIASNILLLEDCLIYDPLTSDKGDWWNGGVTANYNDTGVTLNATASTNTFYLKNTPISAPFSYELTYVDGKANRICLATIVSSELSNSPNYDTEILYWTTNNNWATYSRQGSDFKKGVAYVTLNKGDTVRVEVNDTTVKIYHNDELKATTSIYAVPETLYMGLFVENTFWQTVKDLKIKPYTEE